MELFYVLKIQINHKKIPISQMEKFTFKKKKKLYYNTFLILNFIIIVSLLVMRSQVPS
jgi:hypothetical protein